MMKIIDSNDLHTMANEIISNCKSIDFSINDNPEDNIPFYTKRIRQVAEDLKGIADASRKAPAGGYKQNESAAHSLNTGNHGDK